MRPDHEDGGNKASCLGQRLTEQFLGGKTRETASALWFKSNEDIRKNKTKQKSHLAKKPRKNTGMGGKSSEAFSSVCTPPTFPGFPQAPPTRARGGSYRPGDVPGEL